MTNPTSPLNAPYKVNVEKDKTYSWCSCGLSKKQVGHVFEGLSELITMDLGKRGPGTFSVPGLMKIVKVHKPATKSRKGINPFTKEPMVFKAKPARSIVRVRALKGLKEMVK